MKRMTIPVIYTKREMEASNIDDLRAYMVEVACGEVQTSLREHPKTEDVDIVIQVRCISDGR